MARTPQGAPLGRELKSTKREMWNLASQPGPGRTVGARRCPKSCTRWCGRSVVGRAAGGRAGGRWSGGRPVVGRSTVGRWSVGGALGGRCAILDMARTPQGAPLGRELKSTKREMWNLASQPGPGRTVGARRCPKSCTRWCGRSVVGRAAGGRAGGRWSGGRPVVGRSTVGRWSVGGALGGRCAILDMARTPQGAPLGRELKSTKREMWNLASQPGPGRTIGARRCPKSCTEVAPSSGGRADGRWSGSVVGRRPVGGRSTERSVTAACC